MIQSATGKRYAELSGVKIRMESIPQALSPLIGEAKKWAIVGDTGCEKAIRRASLEELERVLALALPLKEEIWSFADKSQGARQTPIPDEVVLFQIFSAVLLEIEANVALRKSRTKRCIK